MKRVDWTRWAIALILCSGIGRSQVTCQAVSGAAPDSGMSGRVDQPYLYQNFPFRAVYRIVSRTTVGGTTSRDLCSGVAVGPFEILTAAHCFLKANGKLPDEIWVFPAQSDIEGPFATDSVYPYQNAELPFGVAQVLNPNALPPGDPQSNILLYSGWYTNFNFDWDIAVIRVDRPIAGSTKLGFAGTGTIGVDDFSTSTPPPSLVTASGYPGSVPVNNQFQWCIDTTQYRFGQNPPPGGALAPQRFYFSGPVDEGQSGGPVWLWEDDGKPYVFGVISGGPSNANGATGGDPVWATNFNERATLVTNQLLFDISSRIAADESFSAFQPDLIEYTCPSGSNPVTKVPYRCPPGVGTLGTDYPPPPGKALLTPLVYPGGSLSFTYSAQNIGHADSGQVDLSVYLSKNLDIDITTGASTVFSLGQFTAASNIGPGEFIYPYTITNYAVPSCTAPSVCPSPGQYYLGWRMHSASPQYNDRPSDDWIKTGCSGTDLNCYFPNTGWEKWVVIPNQVTVANVLVNAVLVDPLGIHPMQGTFTIDGQSYSQPTPLYLTNGQSAVISAPATEEIPGSKWAYNSWSDHLAQSHTIAGTTTFTTYTVYFFQRYPLTLTSNPAGAGTIVAVNPSSDGYYDAGKPVQVQATANPGYKFTAFSGGFVGPTNPASVTVSSAKTVTANFAAVGTPALTVGCLIPVGFLQGGTGVYVVTAGNPSNAGTSGPVTVTEAVPSGLTLISMNGPGWNCANNQCSRSDALPAGTSYPPLTITVGVNGNAPQQVINHVSVSGGGAAAVSNDTTTAIGTGSTTHCDINGDGLLNTADVVAVLQEGLGLATPAHNLNGDSAVNVVDAQNTLNARLSLGCH